MIEKHVAVVHRRIAILRTDVAHGNSRKRFVGLHVADLDDEGLGSVVDVFFGML
jgi:hypothetical protein